VVIYFWITTKYKKSIKKKWLIYRRIPNVIKKLTSNAYKKLKWLPNKLFFVMLTKTYKKCCVKFLNLLININAKYWNTTHSVTHSTDRYISKTTKRTNFLVLQKAKTHNVQLLHSLFCSKSKRYMKQKCCYLNFLEVYIFFDKLWE